MGMLLGHGVRIGFDPAAPPEVIAVGEGIETMLSLRQALPRMPAIAALSAAHLGALVLPSTVRRLYIATEADGPHGTDWNGWRNAPAPTESRSNRSGPSSAISTMTCD